MTLIDYILGTDNIPFYLAQWFFAMMGGLLSLRLHAMTRDISSDSTPKQFSIRFLIKDNIGRGFTAMLLVFFFLRFPDQLLSVYIPQAGAEWRLALAGGLGFSTDKLAQILKDYNFFGLRDTKVRKELSENQK